MALRTDGSQGVLRSRGRLPHLERLGGAYFVTFRTADAVVRRVDPGDPQAVDLESIARRSEPPLRAGACVLERMHLGALVAASLRHFDDVRYRLGSWCVMPNHVHAIVWPFDDHRLADLVHSWKSFTAKRINRVLGRTGRFWEREYFDYLVRNDAQLRRFEMYIDWNPVHAGLCEHPTEWFLGSAHLLQGPPD